MYQFLLSMWVMKRVTEEKLQTYVPKFITQEEYNTIVAAPQSP